MQNLKLGTLYVFPTGRAIREFYAKNNDTLLPRALSAQEFFEKSCTVENRIRIDDGTRKIYLHRAIKDIEIESLGFAKNFLDFLEHSEFIFLFFDEMDAEFVSLDSIMDADMYAEFDEHIKILKKIHSRYVELLRNDNFYDIAPRAAFEINESFFKNFDEIYFKASGYFTNFELQILLRISLIVPISLEIELTRYNKNMVDKLKKVGFEIDGYALYLFDLARKKCISQVGLKEHPRLVANTFDNRISQCSFVFQKIYEFVKAGIEPQNIAVITPDEEFGDFLKVLDVNKNLNFAKGERLRSVDALRSVLEFVKSGGKDSTHCAGYGVSEFAKALNLQKKSLGYELFLTIFDIFLEEQKGILRQRELDIIKERLFVFDRKKEILKDLSLLEITHLFFEELVERRLDDVNGGKVTVMGVLEGRDVEFEGVIFVDFNEGIVPKPSEKDLFLTSKIKERVSLPTSKEREALQKYYYLKILQNAKNIAIACVKNDENEPSHFLTEIGVEITDGNTKELNRAVLGTSQKKSAWDDEIVLDYDFSLEEFSASKLSMFLECRRKFYFCYVKKIKEPKELGKSAKFGTFVHEALMEFYADAPKNVSQERLKKALWGLLSKKCGKDAVLRFEIELFFRRCEAFFEREQSRFELGYRALFLEKEFRVEIGGVWFCGKVDRIDIGSDGHEIIDYKYKNSIKVDTQKSLEKSSDFQMPIYYLGVGSFLDNVVGAYFYDIKRGLLLKEEMLDEKIELLQQKIELLKEKRHSFEKTEERKKCYYCAYKIICQR